MQKWNYFKRGLLVLFLLVLIETIQLPIVMFKTQQPWFVNFMWAVIYFLGYAIAITITWISFRRVHPARIAPLHSGGVKLVGLFYVGFMVFQVVMIQLSELVFNQSQSANNIAINRMLSTNNWALVTMLIGIVLLSPILEELVFRGLLVDGFFQNAPLWLPMVVSGSIFSLAHSNSNVFTFLVYAGMGAAMVYLNHRTRTIRASILFHIVNNSIAGLGMVVSILASR